MFAVPPEVPHRRRPSRRPMVASRRTTRTGAAALALAAIALLPATPAGGEAPGSVLVGCDRADERVVLTVSAVLDPSCTYHGGFDITASGVELDCRGAVVQSDGGGTGILLTSPIDVALTDVTVRNCEVDGFLNSIRVTRPGFRTLAPGVEYEHAFERILLTDVRVHGSRGVGIFVDGYVTGVTITGSEVRGAGSSGIYLETGSKGTVVEGNEVVDNGFRENGPNGQVRTFAGRQVRFWGPGREGISIDGARDNVIRANTFTGNSAGGIFLYKNCGEFPETNPDRWFDRRYPSTGNLIETNTFTGGRFGVWVASRAGENQLPMECSEPAYVDEDVVKVYLDPASDNVVRGNAFDDVTYGIRVEDDRTTVAGNHFRAADPTHHAVVLGTPYRTQVLGRPVAGTRLIDNVSDIVGNASPYRWVHGESASEVEGNTAAGVTVGICEGVPIPANVFLMVIAFAPEPTDGSIPPTPDLTPHDIGALPACPAATSSTTAPSTSTTPANLPIATPRFTA